VNIVQATLEKLRNARRARAAYDRQVADATKAAQRKIELVLDKVMNELPLKTRDECVLLTDEEYAIYAQKHFTLQLSVAGTILLSLPQAESDAEPDWDGTPSEDF
jgi:uncharacterized metal-binding protein YceD (DUF177 family)